MKTWSGVLFARPFDSGVVFVVVVVVAAAIAASVSASWSTAAVFWVAFRTVWLCYRHFEPLIRWTGYLLLHLLILLSDQATQFPCRHVEGFRFPS